MASFHDIPTELLLNILSNIDKSDLCSTALLSRLFHRLSTPLLYHTYRNKVDGDLNDRVEPRSLINFTKTIVANRRLGAQVKILDLGRWITQWETDLYSELVPLSPQDVQLFLEAGFHLELSDNPDEEQRIPDNWSNSLTIGVEDALVRLLLSNLPELEEVRLIMGSSPVPPWTFIRRMARYPNSWPSGRLAKLHTLEVMHDTDDELGVNLGRFTGFFHLPSLRTVRGSGWMEEDDPVFNWTVAPGSSNVAHLDLSSCSINEISLRALLESCQSIKILRYSSSNNGTQQFTPRALRRILRPYRRSLEQLSLTMFSEHWEDFDIAADEYKLGSLRHYKVLRHLDMEEYSLLGHGEWYHDESELPSLVDLLPPSLETLRITRCHSLVKTALVEILALNFTRFRRLRSVEVVMTTDHLDNDLAMLADLFAQLGIDFHCSTEMDTS